ncbi:MAG: 50S ribosomal protein L18 [Patescibacteria group bacterium]|nr:50S ribosomal protein L18 [Patescibacteria group bacterium]
MNELKKTQQQRIARAKRTKARLVVGAHRPRLIINRSHKAIYAQIVDINGQVLAAASSLKSTSKNLTEGAKLVGEAIADLALAKKIEQVAFDRKHYRYHGRVKALAEAAREKGLKF